MTSALLAPLVDRDVDAAGVAAAAALVVAAALPAACRARLAAGRRVHGTARGWEARGQPARRPGAGGALVVGALGVLLATGNATWWLGVALALLAAAGWWHASGPVLRRAGLAVGALGAWMLGFGPGGALGPLWVRALVVVATLGVTVALASFERRWGRATLPLVLLAAGGIYGTTPDTQQSLVLLGAALGAAVAGWWLSGGLGAAGAPAVAGLVVWTVAVGGRGRHSAIVGGLGCLGVLLAEPAAAGLRRAARRRRGAAGVAGRRRSVDEIAPWRYKNVQRTSPDPDPDQRPAPLPSRHRPWWVVLATGCLQAAVVSGCHLAGVGRSTWWAAAGTVAVLLVATGLAVLLVPVAAVEPAPP